MKSRRSRILHCSLVERELPAQWAEGLDSQYHLLGGSSSSRRLRRENAAAGRRTGEPPSPRRARNLFPAGSAAFSPRGNPAVRRKPIRQDNPSGGCAATSLYTREALRGHIPRARWECRGCFWASGGAEGIVTPGDFSLVPPGGTVSFCKKEMVGLTVPAWKAGPLVCGPWPHSSSRAVRGTVSAALRVA